MFTRTACRILLFLYFLLPILTATKTNEHCTLHRKQLQTTPNNKWIVVNWENGGCYYHNSETKENRDTYPHLK